MDETGLTYLWSKLKAAFLPKTATVDGFSYNSSGNIVRYGTCPTAAATAAKVATLSDTNASFTLAVGTIIYIKFSYSNAVANPTLNVNGTGAISIKCYGTAAPSTTANASWVAGSVRGFVYDGTYWMLLNWGLTGNDNTVPQAYSTTAAATAAKTATCTNYNLLANSYLMFLISTTNTAASALTLNVNSKGAKPIYINGTASSASNYTLPAGTYLVYYDGTNYYLRTDGKITGDITGDAATVNGKTVGVNVPSNAVFTDTDTKVNVTLATTTKAYLLGTSTTPTSTAQGVTALSDTGVYLDTTAGKLTATSFAGNGASLTSLNGSNISSGTVAAARIASLDASKITSGTFDRDRLPAATVNYPGAMSAADKAKLDSIDVSLVGAGVYKIRNLTVSPATSVTLAITEQYGVDSDWDADAIFLNGTQKNLTSPLSITTSANAITLTTDTLPIGDLKLDVRFMKLTNWTVYA